MLRRAPLLLAGAVLGAALTLAILAVMSPTRLFGVSDAAIGYAVGSFEPCDRVGRARWRCHVTGGDSFTHTYSVIVSPSGCWEARSQSAEPLHGCLDLLDYVRP
jgi:hypothetical protein